MLRSTSGWRASINCANVPAFSCTPLRRTPAAEAGVDVNDILIWLDHEELRSVHELHRLLVLREPNRKSRLTVLRKHELVHLWITPRERP